MATLHNWTSIVLVMGASAAAAAPQIAIMGSGDCRDAELIAGQRAFVDEMQRRVPGFEVPPIAERLGQPASRSNEELQRQLEAIRQQFYQGQYPLALQRLQDVLTEIRRLHPGRDQWSLWVSAQLLSGLILHRLERTDDGDEAFRQVLRVDPKYELSADYYAPSTRARFEQLRKELARAKKATLSITSSPSNADVYVDGFLVGKTPFTRSFPAGAYQVALSLGQKRSFPRMLELQVEMHQHVNLAFEGAVHVHPTLCIDDGGSESATFGTAVNLAAMLGTPQLTMLRLVRQVNGSSWLVATLLSTETGERIREGGIQASPDGQPSSALGELTRFISAGEPGPNVQEAPLLVMPKPTLVPSPPVSDTGTVVPASHEVRAPAPSGVSTSGRTWKTPLG
ncbi:MAG: PEGA domain-containing protein, partial [Myxococcaceae bacterium]